MRRSGLLVVFSSGQRANETLRHFATQFRLYVLQVGQHVVILVHRGPVGRDYAASLRGLEPAEAHNYSATISGWGRGGGRDARARTKAKEELIQSRASPSQLDSRGSHHQVWN